MQSGAKRKPTATKVIQGTFRKDRAVNEPKPEAFEGDEPPDFLEGVIERDAWEEFREVLERNGVLTEMDGIALQMLAVAYGKWRAVSKIAKPEPVTSVNGHPMIPPEVSMEKQYSKELLGLLTEFGMTPSSRSRINLPMPKDNKDKEGVEGMLSDGSIG